MDEGKSYYQRQYSVAHSPVAELRWYAIPQPGEVSVGGVPNQRVRAACEIQPGRYQTLAGFV